MSQLHVWFVQLKQTEPVNVRSELQTSSPSDTQIGAKFTGCQWRWWITEHTCYLQFVQHWIQNYTKKIKKKSQKDVQWLQWQRHKRLSEVDKLNIDFRRPGLSSGMCRIWDTCDWVRLKSVCQFCSELHIVQPSDALQFVLLHSELQLQSGLSALDGRANAERAAAGHGPCRLFQPWSCHRLLSGCCLDPSRTLGSRAGVDRLRSRGHKDQDGQRSSLPPVHDHLHWSLLLQLQRRGHMQSCRPALEQVNMTVGRDAQEDRNAGPGCVFNKRNQCVLCKYHFDNISLIQKCLCSLIQALSLFSLIGLFLSNCGLNLSYKHVLTTQPWLDQVL